MTLCMHFVKAVAIVIAIFTVSMAGESENFSSTRSVTFGTPKQPAGKQCIILNRTSPNFESELLAVPPEACVIVIGSWIIKTDYFFKPLEVISPKNDSWWVTWKDFHSPLDVSNNNWSFKLKTKGLKQIVAAISYHF